MAFSFQRHDLWFMMIATILTAIIVTVVDTVKPLTFSGLS